MPQTIYDIAKTIRQVGPNGKVNPGSKPITEGLKRVKFDATDTGLRLVSPEELASVRIAPLVVSENGHRSIEGYQRPTNVPHARRVGRSIAQGVEVPPVNISVDERGTPWMTDGQHRSLGALLARESIWCVVQRRSHEDAVRLFSNQRYAVKPNPALAILTGDDALDLYIQDAVTRDDHPWSALIGAEPFPRRKMGPQTAKMLLAGYVLNTLGIVGGKIRIADVLGDEDGSLGHADELATLLACFGSKDTNPVAFRPLVLRGIGTASILAVRRSERHADDLERWVRWMPTFQFNAFAHVRSSVAFSGLLIDHWNKRLKADRRVVR